MKELRRALDLTQQDLAKQVGYSVVTIRKVEADGRRPSRGLAERLGRCLNVSPDAMPSFIALARTPVGESDEEPPDLDQAPTTGRAPTNLATPLTRLIGRTDETGAVVGLLQRDDVRLVTLVGPPGIGKSRLSVAVAAELEDTFADGVFVVPLAPINDPALVIPTITTTLGLNEGVGQSLLACLIDHLRTRRVLLVLDNVEHLLAAASVLADILTACARLSVLATSREPLRIRGERQFPVPPLALPERAEPLTPAQASRYAAIELFVERAQAVDPGFHLCENNSADVAAICANLDGLPLAIELVAVRINLLAPAELLGRMDQRLALLTGGARDLPVRQQTLRGTIDWSYQLLDAGEQTLFARLSVFIGGCSLSAAEQVANSTDDLPMPVLDGLAALADKNLLRRELRGDGERYFVFFETIREFAMERLVERGEADTMRERYADYYLALTEELADGRDEDWLKRLDAEYDNLRSALDYRITAGEPEPALRLVAALWKFWHIRTYQTEGTRWINQSLALGGPASGTRAAVLNGAGWIAWDQGDNRLGKQHFAESLAIYRELGDTRGVAGALHGVGSLCLAEDNHGEAMVHFTESLRLYRELGDDEGVAWSLDHVGWAAVGLDDLSGVDALFQESFEIFERLGNAWGMAMSLHHQGLAELARGRHAAALERLNDGLKRFDELSNRWGVATSLYHLGQLALAMGGHERARMCFERSLTLIQGRGHRLGPARALEGLACLAVQEEQFARAACLFGAVEATAEATLVHISPFEQRNRDRHVAVVKAKLDPRTLAREWQVGRAMTLDQVTEYALGPLTARRV